VVVDLRGSEEEFTIGLSVFLSVLDVDSSKTLSDGTSALVSSENTLSRGTDLLAGLH